MINCYAASLKNVLATGLRPVTQRLAGVLWHGTGEPDAKAIVASQQWKLPNDWLYVWVGPAIYGFTDLNPSESATVELRAENAAREAAEYKTEIGLSSPPKAVIRAEYEFERVMDLDAVANDELVEGIQKAVTSVTHPSGIWRKKSLNPAFPGKLLHRFQEFLEPEFRPQAYLFKSPPSDYGQSEQSIAIVHLAGVKNYTLG